MMQKR